ncbi:hypothetical protein ACWEP5_36555 [Nocardia niigatensis]
MNPDAESEGRPTEPAGGPAALRDALLAARVRQLVEQDGVPAAQAERSARAAMTERALGILRRRPRDASPEPLRRAQPPGPETGTQQRDLKILRLVGLRPQF